MSINSISSYTTSRNPLSMNYPIKESVESMKAFSEEVVVFDTSDIQEERDYVFSLATNKVKVVHEYWDWKVPNHGIFDGQTKTAARQLCQNEILFQFDLDEVVHENQTNLIRQLALAYLDNMSVLALPVIEYWGNKGKVRTDINLWKPRISNNKSNIVHGIPVWLRKRENGLDYANPGTDGCDYVDKTTGVPIPISLGTDMYQQFPPHVVSRSLQGAKSVEAWFNRWIEQIPAIHHYSWWSIERKIYQYKKFWTEFWQSLYNLPKQEEENPWFPGMCWSEVTPEMIKEKAIELEQGCAGHIFHKPWDGTMTYGMSVNQSRPAIMKRWENENI